jgi:hypothetical protein
MYNTLKMPSTWGVLTMKADTKDAVFCVEQMFKIAMSTAPGNTVEDEPKSLDPASLAKKAHVSLKLLPRGSIGVSPVIRKR